MTSLVALAALNTSLARGGEGSIGAGHGLDAHNANAEGCWWAAVA
eukprot:CAMPEP_0177551472 /NCGR_PEP_ID=MMETSP0369-20130122/66189_1 /TAXON_ID=447022 ORGANISM="Scrippsiella hangoei-like, Strain SHHI-4" /NCGR_SAMPLE_ID=MMETSP0369 /ASSEMBLY_ACC=CAM_ASM_000364 /LENGTH=44 /DNA_ID= /DNA_START= /DNA_END= /DNA_ORIENTATION=